MNQVALCFIFIKFMFAAGSPISTPSPTPCMQQYQRAVQDLATAGNISESVGYIPWCHTDGVRWQVKQCTALNGGSCFCVDPQTGVPRENTRTSDLTWDSLVCEEGSNNSITCEDALLNFLTFLGGNLNVADAPFGYMPSCGENGKFEAMQRNAFYFFCVDVITGQEIPESEYVPGHGRPLTEEICQTFSKLWNDYKIWLEETGLEVLQQKGNILATDETCPEGFEFEVCGCEQNCIPGKEMPERLSCEQCKPICVCPEGKYQHNGTCITSAECLSMEAEPFTFKVKETLWNSYLMVNSNDLLKTYWRLTEENVTIDQGIEDTDVANMTIDLSESSASENLTEVEESAYLFGNFSEEYSELEEDEEDSEEASNAGSSSEMTPNAGSENQPARPISSAQFKAELYDQILQKLPSFLANRLRLFRNHHREMFERLMNVRTATTEEPEVGGNNQTEISNSLNLS